VDYCSSPNIAFTVPADGMDVEFEWNSNSKVLRVIVGGIQGDLSKAQAYWLTADTIAWNVPTDTVVSLFTDPDGALTIDTPVPAEVIWNGERQPIEAGKFRFDGLPERTIVG
jgi:hypothetical protein